MNKNRKSDIHVSLVTTHYPPSLGFGGVCEASFGLSNALAERKIFVDIITSDASKGGRVNFDAFSKLERPKLRIYPFKYDFSERNCFSFRAKRLLTEIIAESDLVYINGIFTHPANLGARCARYIGKPHIIAVRNGLDPWLMRIKHMKKLIGFYLYVKADLKGATCIHLTNIKELDACQRIGITGPFTIIPNGINPSEYENFAEENNAENFWPFLSKRKVVLFLGRLSKEKGLDMLISVWERITKRHTDAVLVIAGPDNLTYGNYIRSLVSGSLLSDTIFFTGNVIGERKLALYSRADIFVLPSYSENFGNVIAEALACGVPVITTKATPWNEIEKNRCGLYVPVDGEAIGEAIDKLLNMPDKERKEMGRRGKDFILADYTWDISARKMITVYHAMLNGEKIPLYPEPWI